MRPCAKLYSTRSCANAAKRACGSTLGVEFASYADYANGIWELWGDGRQIASADFRLPSVQSLLAKHGFDASLGTAEVISDAFFRLFVRIVEGSGEVAEDPIVTSRIEGLASDYQSLLDDAGLVEASVAFSMVKEHLEGKDVSFCERMAIDEPYASFYSVSPGLVGQDEAAGEELGSTSFRLLVPGGPAITASLVSEEVEQSLEDGERSSICVISASAVDSFEEMAPRLASKGVACDIMGSVPLAKTQIGKACLAFASLHPEALNRDSAIAHAADFAANPYARIRRFRMSDLPSRQRYAANGAEGQMAERTLGSDSLQAIWLEDSLASAEDIVSDLSYASEAWDELRGMLVDGDSEAVMRFESRASSFDALHASMERAALRRLSEACECISMLSANCLADYLGKIAVPLRIRGMVPGEEAPCEEDGKRISCKRVLFLDSSIMDALPPASFDEVVISDVTEAAIGGHESPTFMPTLESKASMRSEISFEHARRAARVTFACALPLLDESGKETFASYPFELFLDELASGKVTVDDIRKMSDEAAMQRLGKEAFEFLSKNCKGRGEEVLSQSIGKMFAEPLSMEVQELEGRGTLDVDIRDYLKMGHGEYGEDVPVLSASQLETYLSCPYRWFLDYAIGHDVPGEKMDALAKGTFAHSLLERFYKRLLGEFGSSHASDVPSSKGIFDQEFDSLVEDMRQTMPGSSRLVANDELGGAELLALKEDVWNSLIQQSNLPDDFVACHLELSFGFGEDRSPEHPDPVPYAGALIRGKIDRIDESEDGAFYVLDYKGSTRAHDAGSGSFDLGDAEGPNAEDGSSSAMARHVQALVYASVAKRLLDGECAGAFYTSYRAKSPKGLLAGSVNGKYASLARLSNPRSEVEGSFDGFLDDVEGLVSQRLKGMTSSEIPLSQSEGCQYCVLEDCPQKLRVGASK